MYHLGMQCPRCHERLVSTARFCHQCGFEAYATDRDRGELRQLTVMFVDLVDSTRLSDGLDPEDLRDLIRAYQGAVGQAVERFDGTIAQYLGDGVLAYFGYPRAHEDDPRRAVLAGLTILSGMEELNARIEREHGVRLALRLSAHTGPVAVGVLGAEGGAQHMAVGKAVNVAARIITAAQPDRFVISGDTHRLVATWVASRSLGATALKGVSTPVELFEVLGERASAVIASGGLVGRSEELSRLEDAWSSVCGDRHGRVVVVHGEPGIGKTRLVQGFRARAGAAASASWLEGRCSELHAGTVLYPVANYLEEALGLRLVQGPKERRQRFEDGLARYRADHSQVLPLFASLLGVPYESGAEPLEATPQRWRLALFEALTALVCGMADEEPVVVLLEDAHWSDPTTMEWLDHLASRIEATPVLVLVTHRTGWTPRWSEARDVRSLALARLPGAEVTRLIERIAGEQRLAPDVVAEIVSRADGIPLFAEELAKMVLESDGGSPRDIPMTLRDSLTARLDRIPGGKEVAQTASVLGRTFSLDLLCRVADGDEAEVRRGVDALLRAQLVEACEGPPEGRYAFAHALIQETSYRLLLRRRRRTVHGRIARALLEDDGEGAARQPEVVAYHLTEADFAREAVGWWQRAGERALAASAADEASAHFRRGLECARGLDGLTDCEIAMQTSLGTALAMREGYGSAAVETAFSRARELAEASQDPGRLFGILRGLAGFYKVRAEHHEGALVGRRLMELAAGTAEPALAMEAAWVLGSVELFRGELLEAEHHLEEALAIYDPAAHRSHASLFGEEPGVAAHLHLAAVLWLLGRPAQASRCVGRGLALARASRHANTAALAHSLACLVYQAMGDVKRVARCGEVAMRIAREQGFSLWRALARMYLGWTVSRAGRAAEGIEEIRSGFEDWRATGARLGLPFQHAILAEELRRAGRGTEALELVEHAAEVAGATGERFFEPELLRLRGELLAEARGGTCNEAEAALAAAVAGAAAQGARALELRAALSQVRIVGAEPEPLACLARCADAVSPWPASTELEEARRLLGCGTP
jgi:class 3 adenylate cyclase/predicted ATPase